MSRKKLIIHPRCKWDEKTIRYEFDLTYQDGGQQKSLYYEVQRDSNVTVVEHYDGVLCAVLFHAMQEQLDIHLLGAASEELLRNLREFQLAWSCWRPNLYRPVDIEVSSVKAAAARPRRSVAALSGGVDSLFTLFRHNSSGEPGDAIEAGLMVHGFDVKLANSHYFDELVDRMAEIQELLGIKFHIVRTNSKELGLQDWEDSCGAQLAACMHLLSGNYSDALIGSSEPYNALVLPWGSNPITDHLLTGSLRIVHDGAAFSRTEKVAFLSRFPAALHALKVCWEGEHQARNCGMCEKCIRTQLNFLAVGIANPPCFDSPLELERIQTLQVRNATSISELRTICEYAERHNINAKWLSLLKSRLARETAKQPAKEFVKLALHRAGLLKLAKALYGILR